MTSKHIKLLITILIIASAFTYLIISSSESSMIYYKTVEEILVEKENFVNTPVRVNGILVENSLKQKPGTDSFIFSLKKNESSLIVKYSGILPDNMKVGKEIIVQGIMDETSNTLNASEILTQCPSKYEEKAQNANK